MSFDFTSGSGMLPGLGVVTFQDVFSPENSHGAVEFGNGLVVGETAVLEATLGA